MNKINNRRIESVKILTLISVLVCLNVIVNTFRIVIAADIEMNLSHIITAVSSYLLGPFLGGITAGISDVIGFFIRPSGFFFPGFTLNAIVQATIFGVMFYKKDITIKRVVIACVLNTVIVSFILTPIWLKVMYDSNAFTLIRVFKASIQLPVDIFFTYVVLNAVNKMGF